MANVRRLAMSLIVVLPCVWQQRIQAGDFSSHVYNAWLADLVSQGRAAGLFVTHDYTNVLFDLLLLHATRTLGSGAGSRLVAALCVLIFFWSAFRFIEVGPGKGSPWRIAPLILMFAYGWTFHMGLLNFYLGLGLSLLAMSLVWKPGGRAGWAGASALFLLACTAHPLPVAWSVAALAFLRLTSAIGRWQRLALAAVAIGCFAAAVYTILPAYGAVWVPLEVPLVPADQFWVYGFKFYPLLIASMVLWGCMLLRLSHQKGAGLFFDPGFLLFAVSLACIFLIPKGFYIKSVSIPLSLIAERLTLPVGITLIAVLAQGAIPAWQTAAAGLIAALYFSSLWVDSRVLNRFEDRVEALVRPLNPGDRVIANFDDQTIRTWALPHLPARACVGRCWYYSNYEPLSGAFSVKCQPGNKIAVCTKAEQDAIAAGEFAPQPGDPPLYELFLAASTLDSVQLRRIEPGQKVSPRKLVMHTLPRWWW